jgi:hypothetical protein
LPPAQEISQLLAAPDGIPELIRRLIPVTDGKSGEINLMAAARDPLVRELVHVLGPELIAEHQAQRDHDSVSADENYSSHYKTDT